MSQAYSGGSDGLALAASPTFAIMALLTGVLGGGPGGDALPGRREGPL